MGKNRQRKRKFLDISLGSLCLKAVPGSSRGTWDRIEIKKKAGREESENTINFFLEFSISFYL